MTNLSEVFIELGTNMKEERAATTPLVGGTTGQVLTKIDGVDYNYDWQTPSGGGGSGPSVTAPAASSMTAGAIVRLVWESGDPAPTIKTSAAAPGGIDIFAGVLQSTVASPGDPAVMLLGVEATDGSATLTPGDTAYLGGGNNLSASPSGFAVGVATSATSAIFTYDFPRPGSVAINAINADATASVTNEFELTIRWLSDSSLALSRIGVGTFGLTRPAELIASAGAAAGIPIASDATVILYDSPDSTLFNATEGFLASKPLQIVQLGAGQVKLDGFAIKCVGNPITNTTNSVIGVIPTALGSTVVSGDLAAADVGPYYTGLDESTGAFLATSYGAIADSGSMYVTGVDILSNRTRDPIPFVRAYAEFEILLVGGSFGFAKSGWLGGSLGLDANSMAIRVAPGGVDLEVWHNGASVATIPGAGGLAFGARFGVLVDTGTSEFWIISTGGVWIGPDPATDPGLPFFPGGLGGGTPWLAIEAQPSGGVQRLYFLPSSLTWTTEAVLAGAVQVGWLHP